jgi:predicted  nucleic acid-binding Zn-ribbon protein
MGLFRRPTPPWAQELLLQMQQLTKGQNKLMTADDAIEAEVAILQSDATALAAAFAALQAEVAAGGAPSAQTLADLEAAVGAVTATVPPAPPAPSS